VWNYPPLLVGSIAGPAVWAGLVAGFMICFFVKPNEEEMKNYYQGVHMVSQTICMSTSSGLITKP
jgi:nucleoside recognition membrane protein YjiH